MIDQERMYNEREVAEVCSVMCGVLAHRSEANHSVQTTGGMETYLRQKDSFFDLVKTLRAHKHVPASLVQKFEGVFEFGSLVRGDAAELEKRLHDNYGVQIVP